MKLQYKITLWIFLILLVVGSAGAAAILHLQRQTAISQFEGSALALATTLHNSLEHDMLEADREHIQDAVNRIAAEALINEVVILSSTQQVYASGESSEIGKTRNDQRTAQVLASGETISRTEEMYGQSEVCVILPVMNKPECYTCHDPEVQIIGAIEVGLDRGPLDAQMREQALLLALIGGLTFAGVGGALIFMLRSTITNPLSKLATAAGRIAQGDLSARAEVERKDEVGMVAHTFNEMAERAEKALHESEERYWQLFQSSPVGIGVASLDGKVLDANRAMEAITGYPIEEFKKINLRDTYVNPEDRKALLEIVKQHGTVVNYPVRLKHKDGTPYDAMLSVSLVHHKGEDVVQITQIDITERKQAEKRQEQLQAELYLSSRLAAIGELAAGVAHEINNPLTGIIGFSQRLMRKSTDEKTRENLERVHNEACRAAKVVENLLTFARQREPKREYSDINDILKKALDLRAYELKTSNIEVETDLAPNLPRIMADFHQIQEVFLNIILNAEQVMTEANHGGKLSIKTQQVNNHIRISFTDDGPGISAKHINKLFDPFFTTRGEKGGTGLGLSICHGIITEHGGKIHAKSRPGKGATFFIELPLTAEKISGGKATEEVPVD